jgi:carboxylesterase type B
MKDPKPLAEKWTEVYNATAEKMYCMQKNYLMPNPTVSGVEDCLYLYVYRPKVRHLVEKSLVKFLYPEL